ncbi:response regulator [Halorubellus sp. PRR65]|uniref:response regulator n=1 Tax=Halorubellus sp. PRR65 TaxID=3098148 RepID=UPI002B25F678|nr:response regulator [Halorubellus sp. PRR65]
MPPEQPEDHGTGRWEPVSAENFGAALGDPSRRNVLFHLKRHRTASFDDLVDVVVATVPSRTAADADEGRAAVASALFHLHLPKLELLGVVDWNGDRNDVVLRADPDRLAEWLELSFAESVHGATGTNDVAVLGDTDGIEVLFVDDYAPLLEVIVDQFAAEHDDISVTTASNPESALDALESTVFDCIVSDYDMPGSSGLDFLKAIRRVDETVPFVIYTGKGTEKTRIEAEDHGVTAYLQKRGGAAQFDLLADRIRQVVAEYRNGTYPAS